MRNHITNQKRDKKSMERNASRFLLVALSVLVALFAIHESRQLNVQAQTSNTKLTGVEILRAAGKACLQVASIKYEFDQETMIDKRAVLTATGVAYQARANVRATGFVPGKYSVSGRLIWPGRRPQDFAFSYNGISFRILDPDSKTVLVINSPTEYIVGQMIGFDKGALGFPPLSDNDPFKALIDRADKIDYEGVVEINGIPCQAVSITFTFERPGFPKTTITSHWYFGTKDYLPRRLETPQNRLTMRTFEVNKAIDETRFFVNAPDGYGEKLVTGKEAHTSGLLAVGTLAPDWSLPDAQGRMVSLKDYRGQIVVMDFWGTWCMPCRKSMPQVQAIYDAFKDRGVVVIGVAVADEEGDPAAYMKHYQYSYGLLMKGDSVAKLYAALVLPTLYVIGPDGKILHAEFGHRESMETELRALIENTLKLAR